MKKNIKLPKTTKKKESVTRALNKIISPRKKKLKEYKLVAFVGVEIDDADKMAFLDDLTDALVDCIEKYKGYVGGGFNLRPFTKKDLGE